MSERVAFVLPGYEASVEEDNYQKVVELYLESGFTVEEIDIEWSKSFWKNCDKVEEMIEKRLEN